jgi:hypothetical protein
LTWAIAHISRSKIILVDATNENGAIETPSSILREDHVKEIISLLGGNNHSNQWEV